MKSCRIEAPQRQLEILAEPGGPVSFWFRRFGVGLLAAFLSSATGFATPPEIEIATAEGNLAHGSLAVWGSNKHGQANVPAEISDLRSVAAGYGHIAALTNEGKVVAWGRNESGQADVPPAAQSGVSMVATGYAHTVALKTDGTVLAWGSNEFQKIVVPPAARTGVKAIATGYQHSVALRNDGAVIAWGSDEYGQATVPPEAASGVRAIAAGDDHTVALKEDGSVIAWGWGIHGQTNVPDEARSGVIAIAAGGFHTVALKADGSVIAWGRSFEGQTNVPAAALSGVRAIVAGGYHTVALKDDRSVVVWGKNSDGQSDVPASVSGAIGVAAGEFYTVALQNSSVGFASQTVGMTGEAKTFTIKNTGGSPLRLMGVSVSGGDAEDFAVQTSGMPGEVSAPAGETHFTVTFTPRRPGVRKSTLHVLSDDADESTFDIPLSGTGALPDAGEDVSFTSLKNAIEIDVLENAPGVDRSKVVITLNAQPRFGKVRIIRGKVRYVPTRSLPVGGDAFTYRYDDGQGGIGTGTVTIENFAATSGQFDGLIEADPAGTAQERHDRSGYLRVSLSKTGALTGAFTLGAAKLNPIRTAETRKLAFVGQVDSAGDFVRTFERPGFTPITLMLHVDADTQTITGSAAAAGEAASFATPITLAKRTPARPIAGKYTVQIDASDVPGAPADSGAACVRISSGGDVIIVGRLADGVPFSSATFLHADRSFPVYTALYPGRAATRGSIRGTMVFPGETARASTLEWFKPARPRDRFFPAGFAVNSVAHFTE